MIPVHSLRFRLVVFLVALLGVVQLSSFALTSSASYSAARGKIEDEFGVAQKVFARELQRNAQQQTEAADVLAADFAFRQAIVTGDVATVESALENQGSRIGAQALQYVDLRGRVVADSLSPGEAQHPFELPSLIKLAGATGNASAIGMIDKRVFQVIAVPVRAPVTLGWIVVCFPIDTALAQELRQLTGLQVSFALQSRQRHWTVVASTMPSVEAGYLPLELGAQSNALRSGVLNTREGPPNRYAS